MEPECYQLKWHSFEAHMQACVATLLHSETFADVVLSTADGRHISGHRFVLAASSTYLQRLLGAGSMVAHNHLPVVVIMPPEVSYHALCVLIKYMYSGEATVPNSQLNAVLRAGDILKVRGLWRPGASQHGSSGSSSSRPHHLVQAMKGYMRRAAPRADDYAAASAASAAGMAVHRHFMDPAAAAASAPPADHTPPDGRGGGREMGHEDPTVAARSAPRPRGPGRPPLHASRMASRLASRRGVKDYRDSKDELKARRREARRRERIHLVARAAAAAATATASASTSTSTSAFAPTPASVPAPASVSASVSTSASSKSLLKKAAPPTNGVAAAAQPDPVLDERLGEALDERLQQAEEAAVAAVAEAAVGADVKVEGAGDRTAEAADDTTEPAVEATPVADADEAVVTEDGLELGSKAEAKADVKATAWKRPDKRGDDDDPRTILDGIGALANLVVGEMRIKEEPIEWDMESEVREALMEDAHEAHDVPAELRVKPEAAEPSDREELLFSPLTCELCSVTFFSPAEWVRHAEAEHGELRRRPRRRTPKGRQSSHDSDRSGLSASTSSERTNAGTPGPGSCSGSTSSAATPASAASASPAPASGRGPYAQLVCDVCKEAFTSPALWARHLQTSHTDEELAVHNRASRLDGRQGRHRVYGHHHGASHHGSGSSSHHSKQIKSALKRCGLCAKAFLSKASLQIHRRTHTGERPFVCHRCGYGFSVKSNLVRHVRTLHQGEDAGGEAPPMPPTPPDDYRHPSPASPASAASPASPGAASCASPHRDAE